MCNQLTGDVTRTYRVSSLFYENAKKEFSIVNSHRHKGKIISASHRAAISKFMKEHNPNKGKLGDKHHAYQIPKSEEVKRQISQTKKNNPEKNSQFKGWYVTPTGVFASAPTAADKNNIRIERIYSRCKHSSTIINNNHIAQNKDLSMVDRGKTFKELSWDFLPSPS